LRGRPPQSISTECLLNISVSFMGSRESGAQKHKDHAQDCGTLIAMRDQRPAILPWSSYFGWRPSSRQSRASCPAQRPDCCWTFVGHILFRMMPLHMIVSEQFGVRFPGRSCENARKQRVYSLKSTTNVMLFEQRLVTRLVLLLDVVEKRAARLHEFQEAAA
jgi:hypothetical protein